MQRFVLTLVRLADRASLFLASVAAMILLLLVVLTVVDVIGRYFFSSPVVGAVELVRICMAGIIFFSFPLMFLRNDHIIVDLLPFFRSGWLAWGTSLVIMAVTAYVAYRVGDRTFDYMIRAIEDEDVTEYLGIPRWPVVGFITLALYSAAVASLLRILRFLVKPGEVPEELHGEGV